MTRKSKHLRGTSVVDVHAYKRRNGKKNPTAGKRWLGRSQIPGTRRYRTKAFETEEEAWAWAEDTHSKMKLGVDHGRVCTIRGLYVEYIEHLQGRNCSPSHVDQCRYVLNLALSQGINDLRDEHLAHRVESFIHGLKARLKSDDGRIRRRTKKDLSARTKNCYLNHLLALVSYAHKRRYIPIDPLHGVVGKVKGPKKLKAIFTPLEISSILKEPVFNEPFWLPFAFMSYCGLRVGEAIHLEWQDIEWEAAEVQVRVKPEYRLKNQKERRALLPERLRDAIHPIAKPSGWIVSQRVRGNRSRWRHWFLRLLKHFSIKPGERSPHSCRHTWACMCSSAGMDPFEIKELAGHSSIQTTMEYCAHRRDFKKMQAGTITPACIIGNHFVA